MKEDRKKVIIKRVLKILIVIILIVVIVALLNNKLSFSKSNKNTNLKKQKIIITKSKEEKYHTSLIMVGDALIHSSVYGDAKTKDGYDFKPMLEYIKPIIKQHNLAYYNQETILGSANIGLSTYPCFNSPYAVGDAFLDAGFNIVSLANNHTLDRGEQAIINSRKYWNKHKEDALVSGSATTQEERDTIDIRKSNNITYTMLAYTTTTNGIKVKKPYHVNVYNKEQVKKDIERVRDKVDVLLVSMHWGEEYTHGITSDQKKIAKYLSSLGVDIVIGSHPHVVEPIEYINNTLVIYSLGNFISGQRGIEKLTGLMVSVDIDKVVKDEQKTTTISNPTAELIYTYSTYNPRANFKLYPYTKLTEKLLPGYKKYYNKYMGIVTSKSNKIIPVKLSGE